MGINGNKINKNEVYKFAKEVDQFLQLLNGVIIQAENERLEEIEKQKYKLEAIVNKFTPTLYEEYSNKTKYAYNAMIQARMEYERLIVNKGSNEAIVSALEKYNAKVAEYNLRKEYRDKLKEIVK
ncbi:hypothetical protein [Bacteroides fragilis]|uniref:hypothetical protein n=1 Tax=Bacteroides fragilis TaxID=817 RepID=UPI0032199D30